ncbi:MAG: UPF0280 family protein [Phycisphaerae bacterium]|nr:UPF0280 family protein [Phycisphaerae bacterium]
MNHKRTCQTFIHKEAVFRICSDQYDAVTDEILRQRKILEAYITDHPEFQHAFEPIELKPNAPEVAHRMAHAAKRVGLGPMAAVAGTMAQLAVEAALNKGAKEAIVENGGDIYLKTTKPVIIGLYAGDNDKLNKLAFELQPEETGISICSSSGKMGHSTSLGNCDLATVVAKDAALADTAATHAANCVKSKDDVETTLNKIAAIEGIDGILIIKEGQIGLAGKLPKLVKHS